LVNDKLRQPQPAGPPATPTTIANRSIEEPPRHIGSRVSVIRWPTARYGLSGRSRRGSTA